MDHSAASQKTLIDKCFKDDKGRLVLGQSPNLALAVWAIAVVASHFIGRGWLHQAFIIIDSAALLIWAILEITQGVNYFRRALGVAVLILAIHNRFFS